MAMARREVLVQLDDALVDQLDQIAERLGTSRSDLLRRGALALITAEELAAADIELQRTYRQTPPDPLIVQSARKLAARTAPEW